MIDFETFITDHVEEVQFTPDSDEECPICRLSYGSENLTVCMRDVPVRIVGIPGCNHIFGKACITQISKEGSRNLCPLCRTQWYKSLNLHTITNPDELCTVVNTFTQRFSCDLNTARGIVFACNPAIAMGIMRLDSGAVWPNIVPMALENINRQKEVLGRVFTALKDRRISATIEAFQDKCDIGFDDTGYNPVVHGLLGNQLVNPFSFRNYHISDAGLVDAVTECLRSWRGRHFEAHFGQVHEDEVKRLLQFESLVSPATIESLLSPATIESLLSPAKISLFLRVETEWLAKMEGDESDFIRLLMEVLWHSLNHYPLSVKCQWLVLWGQ
jgi:hypothetical protein